VSTRRIRRTAAALLTVVAGACSVEAQDSARAVDDEAVPFGLLEADTPPLLPPTSGSSTGATVCFVEDDGLREVEVPLERGATPDEVVAALSRPPADGGGALRTALGDPSPVAGVAVAGGVAQVDLLPSLTALGSDEQLLAVAQLVCTLSARPGVGPVSFTLDGAPVEVPRGDGSVTSSPVSRDDYAELIGG
jgi:hypothetical protein